MCVPHKPHPFGNEYHSITDGVMEKGLEGKTIMWKVKLQEGKDRPKNPDESWAFPSEFPGYSKTATLMLEMTKPIHHTGKIVSMDSGFCVSVGIIAMHDYGVYGQSLIKKRRYWTNNVPGDAIDSCFANKELGSAKTFRKVIDGKHFLVHFHKDNRYVKKIDEYSWSHQ